MWGFPGDTGEGADDRVRATQGVSGDDMTLLYTYRRVKEKRKPREEKGKLVLVDRWARSEKRERKKRKDRRKTTWLDFFRVCSHLRI